MFHPRGGLFFVNAPGIVIVPNGNQSGSVNGGTHKMDIYTAFLAGVLVGHWVLLFAIWRAIIRLIKLIDVLEAERDVTSSDTNLGKAELLDDGSGYERERYMW